MKKMFRKSIRKSIYQVENGKIMRFNTLFSQKKMPQFWNHLNRNLSRKPNSSLSIHDFYEHFKGIMSAEEVGNFTEDQIRVIESVREKVSLCFSGILLSYK